MNPSTTLTEFSHPPDLGMRLMTDGNNAKMVNGNANATPNPSIPMVGRRTSPVAASTSNAPIMGPVQEKETITVVSPMKKDASPPPLSTRESAPDTHLFGSTISNAPKNEMANVTNKMKKIEFGIQWLLSVF